MQPMSAMDKKYRAKDDVHTLIRAKEIQMDKARYKAAMAEAKKQEEKLEYLSGSDGDEGKRK